jgi:hypothetical protein
MKTLYVFEEGNLNILFWVPLLFEKKYSTTTPEVIYRPFGNTDQSEAVISEKIYIWKAGIDIAKRHRNQRLGSYITILGLFYSTICANAFGGRRSVHELF